MRSFYENITNRNVVNLIIRIHSRSETVCSFIGKWSTIYNV